MILYNTKVSEKRRARESTLGQTLHTMGSIGTYVVILLKMIMWQLVYQNVKTEWLRKP